VTLSGSSYAGRRGLKSPDPGPFKRKPPKANLTEGFAFAKPSPRERRSPKRMQASATLQRYTYMNQKRDKPRRGPWRSRAYRAQVRALRCCGADLPHKCGGGKVQASHTGEDKGGSMKASDLSCTQKCPNLHAQWEGRKGAFAGWSRQRRQEWAAGKVRGTMTALGYVDAEDAYRRAA